MSENESIRPARTTKTPLSAISPVAYVGSRATRSVLSHSIQMTAQTKYAQYTRTLNHISNDSRPTCFESKTQHHFRWQEKGWFSRLLSQIAEFRCTSNPSTARAVRKSSKTNSSGFQTKPRLDLISENTEPSWPLSKQKACSIKKSVQIISSIRSRCDATVKSECLAKKKSKRLSIVIETVLELPPLAEMLEPKQLYLLSCTSKRINPCFGVLDVPLKYAKPFAAASGVRWTAEKALRALEDAGSTPFKNAACMTRYYFRRVLDRDTLWQVAQTRNDIRNMRYAFSNRL